MKEKLCKVVMCLIAIPLLWVACVVVCIIGCLMPVVALIKPSLVKATWDGVSFKWAAPKDKEFTYNGKKLGPALTKTVIAQRKSLEKFKKNPSCIELFRITKDDDKAVIVNLIPSGRNEEPFCFAYLGDKECEQLGLREAEE